MVKYEWDPAKARSNLAKHGVEFEFACDVFNDPFAVERFDDAVDHGEDRYIIIGLAHGVVVLTVVYGDRDEDVIRIISARRATPRERDDYEKQKI